MRILTGAFVCENRKNLKMKMCTGYIAHVLILGNSETTKAKLLRLQHSQMVSCQMVEALHLTQSVHASLKLAVKRQIISPFQTGTGKGIVTVLLPLPIRPQPRCAEKDG